MPKLNSFFSENITLENGLFILLMGMYIERRVK